MARHGGYKIIDFGGVTLNDTTAVKIPGIYDAIESTNKMTVASGLVVQSTGGIIEVDDTPIMFVTSEGSYLGKYFGALDFTVKINSNDEVILI